MTARDRLYWQRVNRRAESLSPEMRADVLEAFRIIRESLSDAELARLISSGQIEQIIDDALVDRAFLPLKERLIRTTEQGFKATTRDLPKAGKIDGVPAVSFDHLNPRVIDAVRELDTRVLSSLKTEVRETVRAYVENALRDGRAPKSVAKEIRSMIGLGKSQLEQVENYRAALRGDRSIKTYALRDRRLDRMLAKGPLTPEQIERYTEAYLKRRIAQNANTVATTATLDSYKLGQNLSWHDAREKGVIPPGYELAKTWVQIDRPSKRDEHVPMNGETVPFDSAYSNGQVIPGEGDYNCGCLSRVFIRKAA